MKTARILTKNFQLEKYDGEKVSEDTKVYFDAIWEDVIYDTFMLNEDSKKLDMITNLIVMRQTVFTIISLL